MPYCRTIQEQVLSVMRKGVRYSPAQVHRIWSKKFAPDFGSWGPKWISKEEYTSVRDALRRLTKKGVVQRPAKGIYVRPKQ